MDKINEPNSSSINHDELTEYISSLVDRNHFSKTKRKPVMPEDYRINATPGRDTSNDKPQYPHTPVVPPKAIYPKKIYKSHKKSKDMKKKRIPKPLAFLLSAAILTGSLGAITLGVDYFKSELRDNNLAESQEKLSEFTNNHISEANIKTIQQEDNSLEILNADLNNLLQRYNENPGSVTQEEIKSLLRTCYSIGEKEIFSKIHSALDNYYKDNPEEFRSESDNPDYTYRVGNPKNGDPKYYVAERKETKNGTVIYTNVSGSGNKISSYIGSQLNLLDLINQDTSNFNIETAIQELKNGVTGINNIHTSNIYYKSKFLSGKELVVENYKEIQNNTTNIDYEDR